MAVKKRAEKPVFRTRLKQNNQYGKECTAVCKVADERIQLRESQKPWHEAQEPAADEEAYPIPKDIG